jgi:hypothetical protein
MIAETRLDSLHPTLCAFILDHLSLSSNSIPCTRLLVVRLPDVRTNKVSELLALMNNKSTSLT